MDFITKTRLTKIATQGYKQNGVEKFVRTFTLQFSDDQQTWSTFHENGRDKVKRNACITPIVSIYPHEERTIAKTMSRGETFLACMILFFLSISCAGICFRGLPLCINIFLYLPLCTIFFKEFFWGVGGISCFSRQQIPLWCQQSSILTHVEPS